jgi:hypothetical protein
MAHKWRLVKGSAPQNMPRLQGLVLSPSCFSIAEWMSTGAASVSLGRLRYESNEKSSSSPVMLSRPRRDEGSPGRRSTLRHNPGRREAAVTWWGKRAQLASALACPATPRAQNSAQCKRLA